MSDERKPVMCPWCGGEMVRSAIIARARGCYKATYRCKKCKISAPFGETKSTWREAEDDAYLAATHRPPNRPMTREQVEEMPDLAAVWSHGTLLCQLHAAKDVRRFIQRGWTDGEMFFAAHPTPADIEAARKERANE